MAVWVGGDQITLRLEDPYGESDERKIIRRFMDCLNETTMRQFIDDRGLQVWIRPRDISMVLFDRPTNR